MKSSIRRLYIDEQGTFVARQKHTLINWGCSATPDRLSGAGRIINPSDRVATASNKLLTFQGLSADDSINKPLFTTDKEVARQWIVPEGKVVVQRTKLNGHSGAGIVLAAREEDLIDCPLYVQYIKKKYEFRVHVAFGQVIDVQAKRKRADFEGDTDYAIRNHQTGWVYCRENITEPADLRHNALQTILTLGLDFGAVDIIYNEYQNKSYVLEVNTAPGLEGTTVEKYTNAFAEFFNA